LIGAISDPQLLTSSIEIHNNQSAMVGWCGSGVEHTHRLVVLTMADSGKNIARSIDAPIGLLTRQSKTPLPSPHSSANILNNQLLIAGVAATELHNKQDTFGDDDVVQITGKIAGTNRPVDGFYSEGTTRLELRTSLNTSIMAVGMREGLETTINTP
jgi:hypothetical protein